MSIEAVCNSCDADLNHERTYCGSCYDKQEQAQEESERERERLEERVEELEREVEDLKHQLRASSEVDAMVKKMKETLDPSDEARENPDVFVIKRQS